ncbi:hypothetical protein Y1Q_0014431 [Alligator mississippiensis]|uniref:Uncharacterized protein n=1 Tax=Alligator mississippiensis TaxID=8496 RepID=A0A151PCR5_ALLMI|nr:hypothetical protein Y1Q_0014431 [Alligator mississippiensis]
MSWMKPSNVIDDYARPLCMHNKKLSTCSLAQAHFPSGACENLCDGVAVAKTKSRTSMEQLCLDTKMESLSLVHFIGNV